MLEGIAIATVANGERWGAGQTSATTVREGKMSAESIGKGTFPGKTHASGLQMAVVVDVIRSHLVAPFVIETVAMVILALPTKMWFESYLLRDQATYLGLNYLLSHGYKVNVDFGYQYGLLVLLMVRGWFSLFPATDVSIQPLFFVINIVAAVGIARFAMYMKVGGLGLLFLALTLPVAS